MKLYDWLTSQDRKRHQREMNKLVRKLNKNIENDSLWQGRFYIRQVDSYWYQYEDKSGYELIVTLRFIDKKTGFYWDTREAVNHLRFYNGSRLWWTMNKFITEKTGVWKEDPRPGADEWFNSINW